MEWTFSVSNPSPYPRSDFVRVDLDRFPGAGSYPTSGFVLHLLSPDGEQHLVPFQIDYILGEDLGRRELVFLARGVPASAEDAYATRSAQYALHADGEANSQIEMSRFHDTGLAFNNGSPQPRRHESRLLWDEPTDVELWNRGFRVRIRVCDGAATSAFLNYRLFSTGFGEVIQFAWEPSQAPGPFWGRLDSVDFGAPRTSVCSPKFNIAWARCGPCRAILVLRSQRLTGATGSQAAFLYRVMSVYGTVDAPDLRTYYADDLVLLDEPSQKPISFSPLLSSLLAPPNAPTELMYRDDIPDYFAAWKYFGVDRRGFCAASDTHFETPKVTDCAVNWRIGASTGCKGLSYFAYHGDLGEPFAPTHAVGRFGWYERLLKPIEVVPNSIVRKE
jgi:hypothetical protein